MYYYNKADILVDVTKNTEYYKGHSISKYINNDVKRYERVSYFNRVFKVFGMIIIYKLK